MRPRRKEFEDEGMDQVGEPLAPLARAQRPDFAETSRATGDATQPTATRRQANRSRAAVISNLPPRIKILSMNLLNADLVAMERP
mmetsp:Transcript_8967/g.24276  ORF Transcript_8967/g.24276 Transcript_8967/m.24276 type:complete len:85 (-) Transcript_8967:190-444(-)